MGVKRINVYLVADESLYCPFCGRKIDYLSEEEQCKHVVFTARRVRDEPVYYVDELPEILEREPSRGNELLFIYTSNKYREVYEHAYKKPPAYDQEDYVKRGSIKIEDAVKLLESNVQSESDIILFEVLVYVPFEVLVYVPFLGHEYVVFITLLKEGFNITSM
jgi:hypothetical protein